MNAIAKFGDRAANFARRFVPDPFVIAIFLGVVTLLAGWCVSDKGVVELCGVYARGMLSNAPGALPFGFKMALILVTGHALAAAPVVQRGLVRLAEIPQTSSQAAQLVALTAMGLSLLNWGLGLIGGAFLAREVGRSFRARRAHLNYPLVGAAGYMGLLIWHGGFSGSAPLKVAVESTYGPALDVKTTLFSGLNLFVTLALLVAIPWLFKILGTTPGLQMQGELSPEKHEEERSHELASDEKGWVPWLEGSVLVMACLVGPLLLALGAWFVKDGTGAVNLTSVILVFWVAGMVLHRGPMAYSRAFGEGARGAGGILLQFPLYFGILAVADQAGLLTQVAAAFSSAASSLQGVVPTEISGPVSTYLSAGFVNLFVPSGGGQWVLQSPVIVQMVQELDLDRAKMVMAFCYGDELTNMLQPFWALPLLSITGLKAREIMGYTIVAMLVALPVFTLALVFF